MRFVPNIPWDKFNRLIEGRSKLTPDLMSVNEILCLAKAHRDDNAWTPPVDVVRLERDGLWTPVMFYCDMLRGGNRHSVVESIIRQRGFDGCSAMPYAFTRDRFAVWETRAGKDSFPIALHSNAPILPTTIGELCSTTEYVGQIKGRLYYVPSNLMNKLDEAKHHGVYFLRERVKILVPYRQQIIDGYKTEEGKYVSPRGVNPERERVHEYTAWMYVGVRAHWDIQPMHMLKRCNAVYPQSRTRNGITYKVPPKEWRADEPYYLFNYRRSKDK